MFFEDPFEQETKSGEWWRMLQKDREAGEPHPEQDVLKARVYLQAWTLHFLVRRSGEQKDLGLDADMMWGLVTVRAPLWARDETILRFVETLGGAVVEHLARWSFTPDDASMIARKFCGRKPTKGKGKASSGKSEGEDASGCVRPGRITVEIDGEEIPVEVKVDGRRRQGEICQIPSGHFIIRLPKNWPQDWLDEDLNGKWKDWMRGMLARKRPESEEIPVHPEKGVATVVINDEIINIDIERSARRTTSVIHFDPKTGRFLIKAPITSSDAELSEGIAKANEAWIAEKLAGIERVPEPSAHVKARPRAASEAESEEEPETPAAPAAGPARAPSESDASGIEPEEVEEEEEGKAAEEAEEDDAGEAGSVADWLGDAPGDLSVELRGVRVPYTLVRNARRRRLSIFVVQSERIEVRCPEWVKDEEAESFMRESADWVLEHLPKRPVEVLKFADGASIPYRGGRATLRLGMPVAQIVPVGGLSEIWLKVPKDADEKRVRTALGELLRRSAWRVINDCWMRVMTHATKLPRGWKLSGARRRWGSCTSDGFIRLSWRLIALADAQIEYVAAHELAHLIEFNHSGAFWTEVGRILPDWRERHERMKGLTGGETLDAL